MENKIRCAALNALARREYSYHELYKKLVYKFQHDDLVEIVLQQLVRDNLLSDERFVESFVIAKQGRGYGPQRIIAELRQRQVSEALILQYVCLEDDVWQQSLYNSWSKHFKRLPKDHKEKAKQMRYLQYRGYSVECIKLLFNELESID